MTNYSIVYADELSTPHKQLVVNGLNRNAFQLKRLGTDNGAFSFAILDNNQAFIAGLQGYNFYGCCHIDLLYVVEIHQKKGYGSMLIQKAGEIGQQRDCLFMSVNTMDFEGLAFYKKHGYEIEFIRKGFEKSSMMYCMRKAIR